MQIKVPALLTLLAVHGCSAMPTTNQPRTVIQAHPANHRETITLDGGVEVEIDYDKSTITATDKNVASIGLLIVDRDDPSIIVFSDTCITQLTGSSTKKNIPDLTGRHLVATVVVYKSTADCWLYQTYSDTNFVDKIPMEFVDHIYDDQWIDVG